MLPVSASNVTTVIGWYTTTHVNDTKEDETNHRCNFDATEYKLDFTVTLDTENVDDNDEDKKDGNPNSYVHMHFPK